MKSRFTRTIALLASAFGLILFIFASSGISDDRGNGQSRGLGPAPSRPGPGFTADNNPGTIGREASATKGAPGFDSQNNPGVTGSEFGRSTAEAASSNSSSHRNAGSFTLGKREETVVTTESSSVDPSERATEVLSGKPEANSPFKGSLLDEGLPNEHGHVEPKPTPKGHHYGWEKGKHNPHRASASPTATPSPTAAPSASPTATPTATASPTASPTS